jgi:hypothetical protein
MWAVSQAAKGLQLQPRQPLSAFPLGPPLGQACVWSQSATAPSWGAWRGHHGPFIHRARSAGGPSSGDRMAVNRQLR